MTENRENPIAQTPAETPANEWERMLSGELYASVAQDPFQEGSLAIEILIKKLNGENVDPWYYTPTGPIFAADVDNYSWF